MDNHTKVTGPFAGTPTVRRCDIGAHPVTADQQWWLGTDASRGWPNNMAATCAAHLPETGAGPFEGRFVRVGSLFEPGRRRWPEGPHLWIDDDIRLGIFLTRPSRREVDAIATGVARFAWTEQGLNGFLLFKYGDSPWNDAPFNPQRLSIPFTREPLARGTHIRVSTFLVQADTGRIAAMRLFSWPAYFLNHVISSIRRLESGTYQETAARAAQRDFYRRYPDGPSMYRLVRALP